MRIDITDGNLHTKFGFFKFYGEDEGLMKWNQAPSHVHPANKMELRIDPVDGNLHSRAGFINYYGIEVGAKKWKAAPRTVAENKHICNKEENIANLRTRTDNIQQNFEPIQRKQKVAVDIEKNSSKICGGEITFRAAELQEMMSSGM